RFGTEFFDVLGEILVHGELPGEANAAKPGPSQAPEQAPPQPSPQPSPPRTSYRRPTIFDDLPRYAAEPQQTDERLVALIERLDRKVEALAAKVDRDEPPEDPPDGPPRSRRRRRSTTSSASGSDAGPRSFSAKAPSMSGTYPAAYTSGSEARIGSMASTVEVDGDATLDAAAHTSGSEASSPVSVNATLDTAAQVSGSEDLEASSPMSVGATLNPAEHASCSEARPNSATPTPAASDDAIWTTQPEAAAVAASVEDKLDRILEALSRRDTTTTRSDTLDHVLDHLEQRDAADQEIAARLDQALQRLGEARAERIELTERLRSLESQLESQRARAEREQLEALTQLQTLLFALFLALSTERGADVSRAAIEHLLRRIHEARALQPALKDLCAPRLTLVRSGPDPPRAS
ncbi:MAG: hypothetical protein KC636_39120, partial [Myxococcales bacterium]|nr:hypothetical protein [Myxococcales bacterium]